MVTDSERREVSARLRVYSHDFDFGDINPQPFRYVMNAVFADRKSHSYYEIFARLADLIDHPTCVYEPTETLTRWDENDHEHIMHCQNCGAEFGYVLFSEDGDVSMDDKPSFCPHCGARVTSGGER